MLGGGLRVERQSFLGGLRLGPRGGITWSPFQSGRTAVRGGAVPGSERWRVGVLTPGAMPLARLRQVDTPDHGASDTLLVVDQLEELFTLCTDQRERGEFVAALLAHAESGTRLAFGMRADFWGELGDHARLAERLVAAAVFLEPLGEDEVRLVVREGARRAGVVSDDDLVETLVRDGANEPGILPHLSVALARTWDRRSEGRLRLAGYEQMAATQYPHPDRLEGAALDQYLVLRGGVRMEEFWVEWLGEYLKAHGFEARSAHTSTTAQEAR